MLGTAFTVFWIVVVAVLSVDLIAAIVLCVIENKLKNRHPDNEGAKMVADATTSITGDVVYLQIQDGVVKVIDELPVIKVKVAGAAETVVAEPVQEEVAAVDDDVADVEDVDESGRVVFIAAEKAKQTYLDKLAA